MLNSASLPGGSTMRGFSLIEMMVAIVIGMIVMVGAVALIVAINKSNSETIQSARLNQELRTLAAVIADDVKRSRRLDDPVSTIGQGTTTSGPYDAIHTDSVSASAFALGGDCVVYGYQGTIGTGSTGTPGSTTDASNTANYRSISRRAVSGVGAIWLTEDTTAPGSPATCPGTSVAQLSSSQVDITSLIFTCVGGSAADPNADKCLDASEVDVTIQGKLTVGDAYMKAITRTFTQPIFIRSDPVKT